MGLISDLGVDGGGIWSPMHKNRWKVRMDLLADEDSGPLRLQAITVDRPKIEFEEIPLDRYNSRAYTPGKYTFQPISITFECDVGGRVLRTLRDQVDFQQRLLVPLSAPTLPAAAGGQDFKFGMSISMYDGDEIVLEEWRLQGCFIQNLDYGDLDYSASETVKVVCTIRYDHAVETVNSPLGGHKATAGA